MIALLRTQVEELSQQVVEKNDEISEFYLPEISRPRTMYLTTLSLSSRAHALSRSPGSSSEGTMRAAGSVLGEEETTLEA